MNRENNASIGRVQGKRGPKLSRKTSRSFFNAPSYSIVKDSFLFPLSYIVPRLDSHPWTREKGGLTKSLFTGTSIRLSILSLPLFVKYSRTMKFYKYLSLIWGVKIFPTLLPLIRENYSCNKCVRNREFCNILNGMWFSSLFLLFSFLVWFRLFFFYKYVEV